MILAIFAAKATTAVLMCARDINPRSHSPISVFPLAKAGRAARAPWMSIRLRYPLPRLVIPRSRGLPPVVNCRGTRPSQAARSRPRLNASAFPTEATKAVAFKGPIPGIVDSSLIEASVRARSANSASNAPIRLSRQRHSSRISSISNLTTAADRNLTGEKLVNLTFELAASLRNYNSPFEKDRAKLVDQRRALADETIPSPMQTLDIELLVALQIDKAHRGTGSRLPRLPRHLDHRSFAPSHKGEHIPATLAAHRGPAL